MTDVQIELGEILETVPHQEKKQVGLLPKEEEGHLSRSVQQRASEVLSGVVLGPGISVSGEQQSARLQDAQTAAEQLFAGEDSAPEEGEDRPHASSSSSPEYAEGERCPE